MVDAQLLRCAKSVVVFDFETTGLSPNSGDRAIELGAVLIENGIITDRFQRLMNPGIRVPVFVENLTGITTSMLKDAAPAQEVMAEFLQFIDGHNLVAHNASFDERFLRAELKRAKLSAFTPLCCSLLLSRRLLPTAVSHGLSHLAHQFHLPSTGEYHRALADAEVTAHLWLLLCDILKSKYEAPALPFSFLQEITKTSRHKLSALIRDRLSSYLSKEYAI